VFIGDEVDAMMTARSSGDASASIGRQPCSTAKLRLRVKMLLLDQMDGFDGAFDFVDAELKQSKEILPFPTTSYCICDRTAKLNGLIKRNSHHLNASDALA